MRALTTTLALQSRLTAGLESLRSPLLAAVRLYWGYQFAVAGWGKLTNLDRTVGWFEHLGIPVPELNAYLASGTELVGGIALILGFGGRLMSVPLAFTMVVAYATAHRAEVLGIWADPDAFLQATPFLFLIASVIVMVFGSGRLSLDHLLLGWLRRTDAGDQRSPAADGPLAATA